MLLYKLKREYEHGSRIRNTTPVNNSGDILYISFTGKIKEYENRITKKIKRKEHGILYHRKMSEVDYKFHWFKSYEDWWDIKED